MNSCNKTQSQISSFLTLLCIPFISCLFLFSSSFASTASTDTDAGTAPEWAEFISALDATTYVIQRDGQSEPEILRVIGIDAPSTLGTTCEDEALGEKIEAYTQNYLEGHKLLLIQDSRMGDTDSDGTLLRNIRVEGKVDIGKKLLLEGYASVSTQDFKWQRRYTRYQNLMIKRGKGIFGICGNTTGKNQEESMIDNDTSGTGPVVISTATPTPIATPTPTSIPVPTSSPINGQCGADANTSRTASPTTGRCSVGAVYWTDEYAVDGTWNWGCRGEHGGSDASCQSAKERVPTPYPATNSSSSSSGGSYSDSCGSGRTLYQGSRGGCYYMSGSSKSYVDRSCCR